MKIQVQIYLPDQNQGTVWGYGTITLDQLLTFQIRILTCEKGAGIKEAFVSFPRRKQGERWEDLVIVEDSLRNQITEAVREAIQMEITKDLYLPPIEVVHLQVFPKEEIPCRRSNDPCPWSYGERDSIKTREIWGVLPDAPILQ